MTPSSDLCDTTFPTVENSTRTRRRGRGERARRWRARNSPQGDQNPNIEVTDRDEQVWYRDGWNDSRHAISLMETLGIRAGGNPLPPELHLALTRAPDEHTSADYTALETLGWDCRSLAGADGVVHPAAIAVATNWIAKSHGGGQVANVYLRTVIGWLVWRGLNGDTARWETGRARAIDLGLGDHQAAAFRQLWFRREYSAAYRSTIGAR